MHVYIPLLFFSGVDYIDAPTPYMMGLHSGVDIASLSMDGVVVVDLEKNCITTSKEIPAIPEPEMSSLRNEILKLLHPNVVWIDSMKADLQSHQQYAKPWSPQKDLKAERQQKLVTLYQLQLEAGRENEKKVLNGVPKTKLEKIRSFQSFWTKLQNLIRKDTYVARPCKLRYSEALVVWSGV
uniref:Putative DENN domain-containing protein n=1 Tax=Helianthus annuus TaxID=4232 RepID=A0A251VG10_HELAN